MRQRVDIVNLNNPDLDIQELERRLELATVMLPDAWCSCDGGYCTCYGHDPGTCDNTLCNCFGYNPCACNGTVCDCYGYQHNVVL